MAILPCGHVYCRSCIETALLPKAECPTCRMSLKYKHCEHTVKPRTLHEENLLLLPDIVKSAAELPSCCARCNRKKAVEHAAKLHSIFSGDIERVTADYRQSRSGDDLTKLSDADKCIHAMVLTSFNVRAQFCWSLTGSSTMCRVRFVLSRGCWEQLGSD
ncbi:hypothetical protein RB595_001689 [Gaeumannomyces hyphopodioides]